MIVTHLPTLLSTDVDLGMLIRELPDDRSAEEHRFGNGGRLEAADPPTEEVELLAGVELLKGLLIR